MVGRAGGSPSFSIALCTYNGEKYLAQQLESLAQQTRLPCELVVFDDGSSDNSRDMLEQFAKASLFPVRLSFNPSNVGSTENFSRAMKACTGDWIALCDQDDVWLPEKLQRFAEAIEQHSDALLFFSDAWMVDEKLESLGYRLWQAIRLGQREQADCLNGHAIAVLNRKFFVTGMSMAFRADQRPHIFPIHASWVHDGWIAHCLAVRGRIVPISEPLALYRQHAGQQIGEQRRTRRQMYQYAKQVGLKHLQSHRVMYAALRDHFIHSDDAASLQPIINDLEGKLTHLDNRLWIHESVWRRPFAFGEWINGRYKRYSSNHHSLIQDLIT